MLREINILGEYHGRVSHWRLLILLFARFVIKSLLKMVGFEFCTGAFWRRRLGFY